MKTKVQDFQFFIDKLNSLDREELKKGLQSDHEQSEIEYQEFSKTFSQGVCYLCSQKIISYNKENPCIHWLLRANNKIEKKDIENALKKKDLFQVIAYLRWVANSETKLKNVNDFEAYEKENLIYHETVKYKEISWTFWVKESDLEGHSTRAINFPHYHLHMTINGKSFINFGDFHIHLSEWDIFNIHAYRGKFTNFGFIVPHGETYSDLFKYFPAESALENMKSTTNEKEAQFHMETFIEAMPGRTLKGEDIAAIFAENKKTGIPLAVLAKKLGGKVKTVVTPINLVRPVFRKKSKR